jgi:hypothetical protein
MASLSASLWEKTIRDGKVAVVISPGYGAGWSTWNSGDLEYDKFFIFGTSDFIKMIESGADESVLTSYVKSHISKTVYLDGIDTLVIKWVPIGTKFRVVEYDGAESVELHDETKWVIA